MGTANRLGWLGKPLDSAIHLAKSRQDLLQGQGAPMTSGCYNRFSGTGVDFTMEDGCLKIVASEPEAQDLRFSMKDISCNGPDLFVSMKASAQSMHGYPKEVARLMKVHVTGTMDMKPVELYSWLNDF